MRSTELNRFQVAWIIARASATYRDDLGHERPRWTYPELSRNFKRSQIGGELSGRAIRGFLLRRVPELVELRAALFMGRTPASLSTATAGNPDEAPRGAARPSRRRGWDVVSP